MAGRHWGTTIHFLLVFMLASSIARHIGVMLPNDPTVASGTTANLTCCLNDIYMYKSTDIEFEQRGNPIANTNLSTTRRDNSSCSTLFIHNIQCKDGGMIYSCRAGTDIIGQQYVTVGYNLRSLDSRLHCVSYNEDKLTCYIDMDSMVTTTVIMSWSRDASTQYICPHEVENEHTCRQQYSCTWKKNDGVDSYYSQVPIHLSVRANNSLGTKTFTKTVEVGFHIVKSEPVHNLTCEVLNNTTALLTWALRLSEDMEWIRNQSGGFQFLVQWSGVNDKQYWNKTFVSISNMLTLSLSDLDPNHHYSVKVMVKPRGGLYWSEPKSLEFWTNFTVPKSAEDSSNIEAGILVAVIAPVLGGFVGFFLIILTGYTGYKVWRKTRKVILIELPPDIEQQENLENMDRSTVGNRYLLMPAEDPVTVQGSQDSGILTGQDDDSSHSTGISTAQSSYDQICPRAGQLQNQTYTQTSSSRIIELSEGTLQGEKFKENIESLSGDTCKCKNCRELLFLYHASRRLCLVPDAINSEKQFKFPDCCVQAAKKRPKSPASGYALLGGVDFSGKSPDNLPLLPGEPDEGDSWELSSKEESLEFEQNLVSDYGLYIKWHITQTRTSQSDLDDTDGDGACSENLNVCGVTSKDFQMENLKVCPDYQGIHNTTDWLSEC